MSFEIIAGLVVVIWALSLPLSVLATLAGPVKLNQRPSSSAAKRAPPPSSPRQNVRRKL